ncbi:MAG: hypothetical protein ABEK04_06240, partial [Candidatus Nanohalobium sp.]
AWLTVLLFSYTSPPELTPEILNNPVLLTVAIFSSGLGLILTVLTWEFSEAVARNTAMNQYLKKSMDRKAVKFLNWLSIKTTGEDLSD